MKEQFTQFEDYNFIESLKTKNPVPFLKSIIKILDKKEKEKLKGFLKDEDLSADLLLLFDKVSVHFRCENLPELIITYVQKLENFVAPDYKNDRSVAEFYFFAIRVFRKNIIPRQTLISKKSIANDFNVDPKTLNHWLLFFDKKKYIGRKDFNGLEWGEIVKDFINVGNLKIDDLSHYHFYPYNRITLAKIIGDLSKADKTLYNDLQSKFDEIDVLNPENKDFILWVKKHRVLPYSLAYRYISLILKSGNYSISAETVFANYMTQNQH